jgi:20S proteasome alpha/beta subunit
VASRPDLAFILGGFDADGTPRIFSLISNFDFNPMLHEYGFAVQGVAQYALYLLNRLYEADRSLDELAALAVYAITETASQDGKVGGPVNVITITPTAPPDGGCKILPRGRVQAIETENATRSQALRASFYSQRGG